VKDKMECFECENPHPFKGRRIVHKYKESGLEHITLSGIEEFKCPQCGAVYLEIPKAKQLNALIAEMLLKRDQVLSGAEIRFLRKQLGYSSEQFGKLISYDPKSLSRIENGHQKVTSTFDRLVKMAYATGKRDLNYNLHDLFLSHGIKYRKLELSWVSGEDWEVKKTAA
jgi:putative zinc finger/helix-turn-helix YgiT family protein